MITVRKWWHRFAEHRLEGLLDEPRPGAPRTIEDARIEAVVARTLESLPTDGTQWSSRGMARASGMSISTVQRVRLAATPLGDIQAVDRPQLRGQGTRRGRPLHGPARTRPGAVR